MFLAAPDGSAMASVVRALLVNRGLLSQILTDDMIWEYQSASFYLLNQFTTAVSGRAFGRVEDI